MAFYPFSYAQLAPTPWKNGGGVTREIAASGDPFDWRVSIAHVDADGPFSIFENVDRIIVLLEGTGLHLKALDGSLDHELSEALQPFSFAGELPLTATMLGGPSVDFNVMTRRGWGQASVNIVRETTELANAVCGLIYAVKGAWSFGSEGGRLQAGEGLWWDEDISMKTQPIALGSALIVVSWVLAC